MPIPFTKMQGLGNDFVVINELEQSFHLSTEQIRHMADRHFGIGCDQLLSIRPASKQGVDFNYHIYNADGSESGQCGNGARCIGLFLHKQGISHKKKIILATISSQIEVCVESDTQISVNMGVPKFKPAEIPFQADEESLSYFLQADDARVEIAAVSMGNPHAVLKVKNVDTAPVATLGPAIERHPRFPEGANVGFVEIVNRQHIRLRVFERGVGETLACGSGACAAVVLGCLQGLLDSPVQVDLSGGKLMIEWAGPGSPVFMKGGAEIVFQGEWLL